jgi:hypothetical protein
MNAARPPTEYSRRGFLAAAARYVTLGLFAAAGGWAVAKRRRLAAQGVCVNDGICDGCAIRADCGLPERQR